MQNDPNRHHFLPVFYLKQWADEDRLVTQFSRPHRDIKPLRRHPKAVGYITKLYAVEGLSPDLANAMEKDFLSPVDNRAADALATMLASGGTKSLNDAQRLAWTRFLASLVTRMPSDIYRLRSAFKSAMDLIIPAFQDLYEVVKDASWPTTANDFMGQQLTDIVSQQVIELIREVIDHPQFADGLLSLEWRVKTLDRIQNDLLTSDRPVIFTRNEGGAGQSMSLAGPMGHLVLPIGPRSIFIAAHKNVLHQLDDFSNEQIARSLNMAVVGGAEALVFGRTDKQLRFVQNRLGQAIQPSFFNAIDPILQNLGAQVSGMKLPIDLDVVKDVVNAVRDKAISPDEIRRKLSSAIKPE